MSSTTLLCLFVVYTIFVYFMPKVYATLGTILYFFIIVGNTLNDYGEDAATELFDEDHYMDTLVTAATVFVEDHPGLLKVWWYR